MKRLLVALLAVLMLTSCAPKPFSVPEIKDIGPYVDNSENYYRFYPDYVDAFIPSDAYGEVYPFIGNSLDFGSYAGNTYLYGLCTADGGIVCDPVYTYYGCVTLGDYLFYIMVESDIYPDPERSYNGLGKENYVLIRNDGRFCRVLDGTPAIRVNGEYLQLDISTMNFEFLDKELETYHGFVQPQWSSRYPSDNFYGKCPCCNKNAVIKSKLRTRLADHPYVFVHNSSQQNIACFFTLDGEPITTISVPDGVTLSPTTLTELYIYGRIQPTDPDMPLQPFLYLRQTDQYAKLPEDTSISWLYDDIFTLSRYDEEGLNAKYIYDASEDTATEFDDVALCGATTVATIKDGISSTLHKGEEMIRIRLNVD
ncbi:MAG: hypothetical protein J6R33_00500 [Clostridia bacterium]|nr:hypothetical protein [Clostridia bacterium]